VSAESQVADAYASGPVLFAYDGSPQAKAAIREAAGQLRRGREAIVLRVWEPPAALAVAGVPVVPPQLETDFEREAGDLAREGADLARSLGFEATPVVASGEPVWRTIVDVADAHGASILVLGSHGRTGIGLVVMGSVASTVARHTERPVMIVHRVPEDRAA
jgi:nucleotide-binding universal stress UspA family protein